MSMMPSRQTTHPEPTRAEQGLVCGAPARAAGRYQSARGEVGGYVRRRCNRPVDTPGPCWQHRGPLPSEAPTFEERIRRSVEVNDEGCWIWQLSKTDDGYGRILLDGIATYAHRATYRHWNGEIPDGHQVDHLCLTRSCCNPKHLEAVTPRENTLRAVSPRAKDRRKTHCNQGHPYDDLNTQVGPTGKRSCHTCSAGRAANRKTARLSGITPTTEEKSTDER